MITKYKYIVDTAGKVSRSADYSFTSKEDLEQRLNGITDVAIINSLVERTLLGESVRKSINVEDAWFKIQTTIQDMDTERKTLEASIVKGDKGVPFTPAKLKLISARIAELKEGKIVVKKEFYDHYTRNKMLVDEVTQTPYTLALEARLDAEAKTPYLAGLRGVKTAPAKPEDVIDPVIEQSIRKELVRQKIGATVGDDKDLIADTSKVVSLLIKKSSGTVLTADEEAVVAKYVSRQTAIATILATDYKKK